MSSLIESFLKQTFRTFRLQNSKGNVTSNIDITKLKLNIFFFFVSAVQRNSVDRNKEWRIHRMKINVNNKIVIYPRCQRL